MQVENSASGPNSGAYEGRSPELRTVAMAAPLDVRGRHRIRAELNKLQQEIRLLEEEARLLQQAPPASKACKEMVEFIASTPDPFLSNPSAPSKAARNRWFEAPMEATDCCCWR